MSKTSYKDTFLEKSEDLIRELYIRYRHKSEISESEIYEIFCNEKEEIKKYLIEIKKKGYITSEGNTIRLTASGLSKGEELYRKRNAILDFFREVLLIDEKEAEVDACKLEHFISENAINRLIRLADILERCKSGKSILKRYEKYITGKENQLDEECEKLKFTLDRLKIGEKGRIKSFITTQRLKKRFIELGIMIGDTVEVLGFAPLGDPIEIKVKNTNISIRKEEAKGIIVEKV